VRQVQKLILTMLFATTSNTSATELEVAHWWTSGGEAEAVAELARAFDASGNRWVDGAIAGGPSLAIPVMISRITGGDPMGAMQLNHGLQAKELIEAGLMQDLTDVVISEGWNEIVYPPELLEACTVDGRIYCAPINIHSWQWMWLSNKAYQDAGVAVPKNWTEFVATAPALRKAGKIPLALGQQPWQASGAFGVLFVAIVGPEIYDKVFKDHDSKIAAGAEVRRAFKAADDARKLAAKSNVQDWNQATNMVITGKAGGQIMGDWAEAEFQSAGQVAGKDYTCLPGLGVHELISTSGDAFYFPVLNDKAKTKAQMELAALMLKPAVQVAFNLKKGSLPVRGDVDLSVVSSCMKKGLDILAKGSVIQDAAQLIDPDTSGQMNDLFVEFFNNPELSQEEAQQRFVELIEDIDID